MQNACERCKSLVDYNDNGGETEYRIVGNFGEVFNLVNWRFCRKSPN